MENIAENDVVQEVTEGKVVEKVPNLVSEGKNKFLVVCVRCPSKILNPGIGEYKEIEFPLPRMVRSKTDISLESNENLNRYWLVTDKFAFENVGFSNTVSGFKYLTCADCEVGPIGWYDPDLKYSYLSLDRVKHVTE